MELPPPLSRPASERPRDVLAEPMGAGVVTAQTCGRPIREQRREAQLVVKAPEEVFGASLSSAVGGVAGVRGQRKRLGCPQKSSLTSTHRYVPLQQLTTFVTFRRK